MYNTIAYFSIVINALALVAFPLRLFGSANLKEKNHFINKKKKHNYLFLLLMQHARLDKIATTNFDLAILRSTFIRLAK
jgi:hypothetical protein